MSDNLKKYSFCDLLKQGNLRIPKIQRDYAQGRKSQKVNEIRKVFVHTLLLVVKGKRPSTELDFIYGSNNDNAFEPLDGQQRMTTLFLLHWMMGVDLSVSGDKNHSVFTYETRNTSGELCDELVLHPADQFVKEASANHLRNLENKDNEKKPDTPSAIIKGRDWFKWEWKYDPTILSMLVMIDAIYEEMGIAWEMDLSKCRENLEHITFNLLNLGKFGLSNELFIKMNARGKQLSDFDKLKSTLEEELQLQQKEKDEKETFLATEKDEEMWRTLMDGAWIDLFWHKYARMTIENEKALSDVDRKIERLKAAKLSELQFKKLLLRLIAIQLFESNKASEKVSESVYNIDEENIDNLLFVYTDSLTELRSDEKHVVVPDSLLTIDFNRLIEDMNLLIYKEENKIFYETSFLLPKISHIENNDCSLFDSFLAPKVPNDVELTFYAMLLFLRAFPIAKIKKNEEDTLAWYFNKEEHKPWLTNFEHWVRSMRNILLNDNNNQRIDKRQFSLEATQSLKQVAKDLVEYVNSNGLDIDTCDSAVKEFLKSIGSKTYQRLDNQSFLEEVLKAKLYLEDRNWERTINDAESHPYLWGQIRCLLNWSGNDISQFKAYSNRLIQLLDFIPKDDLKYYTAMLAFAPGCWHDSNRLFLYNRDRDNSFKRYMREHTKEGMAYGANLKALIDLWIGSYENLSLDVFLSELIKLKISEAEPWIQCIDKYPSILNEAWNKRVYEVNGHVVLAQRKTQDSHCFDPILVYLRNLCLQRSYPEKDYKLHDSKGDFVHAFELNDGNTSYLIKWDEINGMYSIKIEDNEDISSYTAADLISFMEKVITPIVSTVN